MSNNSFHERGWKYIAVGLMAVLAVGFSFPQASAHLTNNVQHMLEHIFNTTNDTNKKVTNIQGELNSSAYGLQEIRNAVGTRSSQTSIDDLEAKLHVIKCNNAIFREHADLSGCDFSFIVFPDVILVHANLRDADLHNAQLQGARLSNADVSNANLERINLRDAFFQEANFSGANLTNAELHNASFALVDFSGANLTNARLINTAFTQVDFSGANLTNANFDGASIISPNDFTGCIGDPIGTPAVGTLPDCD